MNKGTHQTTVTITVRMNALQLLFPMYGTERVLQSVRLTYSLGPHGGKRPWFVCPICPRRAGVLYHARGLPFRYRICCKLAYPSQYQSRNQSYGCQHRMVSYREQERLSAQCSRETERFRGELPLPVPWPFKLPGTEISQRGMTLPPVIESFDIACSETVDDKTSSVFKLAKKLSTTALSQQFPGRMHF